MCQYGTDVPRALLKSSERVSFMTNAPEYISMTQAADMLGINSTLVHRLVLGGLLGFEGEPTSDCMVRYIDVEKHKPLIEVVVHYVDGGVGTFDDFIRVIGMGIRQEG